MAGLCGWVGKITSNTDQIKLSEQMSNELTRYDLSSISRYCGNDWCVNIAKIKGESNAYYNNGVLVVLFGRPKIIFENKLSELNSDNSAETIRELFVKYDVDLFKYITGNYSLIIYVESAKRLLLSTDRLGIYPLFYSIKNSNIIFSTSLKTFGNKKLINTEINYQSIYDYLYFHMIPSPNTIYKEVFSLEPGNYIDKKNGEFSKNTYWKIEYENENEKININELKEEFLNILHMAISNEIEQSNNIGCFLSGGTDSSTITGLLGKVSGDPTKTYSIGFDVHGFDEIEYARIAARHFDTEHKIYYVTPNDVINCIPKISQIYGQPFGNSSVVPTYYCAKLAKEDGIEKLLGGDGGDELFGGNERYAKQILFSKYNLIPVILRHYIIEPIFNKTHIKNNIPLFYKFKRYIEQAKIEMPERIAIYNYMNQLNLSKMLDTEFVDNIDLTLPLFSLKKLYNSSNAQEMINKMQTMDLKITLADNDLPKVNKMCELAGVNVGYPLLNSKLVELSARLPVSYKVRGRKLRYFFKEALKDTLPIEILKKKKHGFGLPFGNWMVSDKNLRHMTCDTLQDLKRRNIIRPEFIDDLIDNRLHEHANYYGGFAWILLMLEFWFKENEQ